MSATNGQVTRHTPLADLAEFLRVDEVAAHLDCSKGTVYEAIRCGQLRHCRIGRLVRIPRDAVRDWATNGHREKVRETTS